MQHSIRLAAAVGLIGVPVLGAGLGGLGLASASETASLVEATMPKLVIVKFHADWCGKCKAMKSPLDSARRSLIEEPVLFVTYDFTDESKARQAEYLASVLGQDEVWSEYERRTGFALIVNPDTGEVVGELKTPDAEAIESAVRMHL